MAIREKRFLCGKYLEVEIYPISKYEQKKSRSKKKMESRKEQKNLNDKNARKNLRRRIHANFDNKDLIVSLSYDAANLRFIYTAHDVVFNDIDGGIYVYIKMRRL